MTTEIKVIRYSESPSHIRYRLYVDNVYREGFDTFDEAERAADALIIELKQGYPKSETVYREIVEHLKTN